MRFVRATIASAALIFAGCQAASPHVNDPAKSQVTPSALLRDGWNRTTSLTPSGLAERLQAFEEGRWTLEFAGTPTCSVEVYHYEYNSVDGKGASATASGALMTPSGSDARCMGPRPIVVGLHGTVTDKPYNLADLSGANPASARALAWAGVYASQGYIVVAPNYTGLDTSTASHQSYLDASQQTEDVLRALSAARELLPRVSGQASSKLFLVGYSQGGWLTMATHREMEKRGLQLTASVPMSGPYALTAVSDDVFAGRPVQGSTMFIPLIVDAYQSAYGDIYATATDLFSSGYAGSAPGLLPSSIPMATLIKDNKLPATALFPVTTSLSPSVSTSVRKLIADGSPSKEPAEFARIYAAGFGTNSLLSEKSRLDYLEDIQAHPDGGWQSGGNGEPAPMSNHPLRRALLRNDMRGWTPKTPMMMCGGPGDAVAPFRYGGAFMIHYWEEPRRAPKAGIVSLLDIEAPIVPNDQFWMLKTDFRSRKGPFMRDTQVPAWVDPYHQLLLPRYCYLAARQYFDGMK